LLLYKSLNLVFFGYNWQRIQPFFTHTINTAIFKTEALCLVSIEGHLLLLYKRLIQPYLSCNWWRILLLGSRLLMTSMARAIKRSWKVAAIIQLSYSLNHTTSYLWPRGRTHTHAYFQGRKWLQETRHFSWCMPGLKICSCSSTIKLWFLHYFWALHFAQCVLPWYWFIIYYKLLLEISLHDYHNLQLHNNVVYYIA